MTSRQPPSSLDRRIRWAANWVGFTLLWGWIIASLVLGPRMLGFPLVGVVLGLGALVLAWQAASASNHPVHTIGTRRGVTTEQITEPGYDCDECGVPAMGGERRRYTTQRVLFGTTVAVPEWGENHYCEACADGAVRDVDADGLDGSAVEYTTDESFETDRS